MKISTKGRYGLNAMYYLALKNDGEPMSLRELADKTSVTQPYLEKVLGILKRHKLVNTTRGVMGGYTLAKSPCDITIGQILRALESDLVFSDCAKTGKCGNPKCRNKSIFKIIYDKLNTVLDEITLQQMIENEGEING